MPERCNIRASLTGVTIVMPRFLPKEFAALAVVASLAGAGPASAQGWLTLPNGATGYATDFTTSARFYCTPWLLFGTCNASGNSVVLGNAGNTMTITFIGVSRQVTASNQTQAPIKIGT